jgi:hypothetical protein
MFFFSSCSSENSDSWKNEKENIKKNSSSEGKKDLAGIPSKEDFENKLQELGIPVYNDAKFYKIKRDSHGNGFTALYFIPDNSEKAVEKTGEFYAQKINKVFSEDKYMVADITDNFKIIKKKGKTIASVANSRTLKSQRHLLQIGLVIDRL